MRIQLATQSESVEILSQPRVVARTKLEPHYVAYQPWMCMPDDGPERMMFVFWALEDEGVYEVHIAAKQDRESLLLSRRMALYITEWLFAHGASKLVTNCPEGRIANMARKIGYTEAGREGETVFFEVSKWV